MAFVPGLVPVVFGCSLILKLVAVPVNWSFSFDSRFGLLLTVLRFFSESLFSSSPEVSFLDVLVWP